MNDAARQPAHHEMGFASDSHVMLIGPNSLRDRGLALAISRLDFGHRLHVAPSVGDALVCIEEMRAQGAFSAPDLVLLMQAAIMPDCAGVLKQLRAHPAMRAAPIVVLTRVVDRTMERTLLRHGVNAVIPADRLESEAHTISNTVADNWLNGSCAGCERPLPCAGSNRCPNA